MSAVAVPIPDMGESVSEAILVSWLKETGEAVAIDEPICVLETDKADVELPSPAAGVLTTEKQPGDTVQVGDSIGTIDPAGAPAAGASRLADYVGTEPGRRAGRTQRFTCRPPTTAGTRPRQRRGGRVDTRYW